MADATASIWLDIDATAYVYTDDTTGVTYAEAATVESIILDFDGIATAMEVKAKATQSLFSSIKDDISSIDPSDYTPSNIMDAFTNQGLNAGYGVTGWLQNPTAASDMTKIADKCGLLSDSNNPKYGDIARKIESVKKGVVKKVTDIVDDVASDIAEQAGKTIQEWGIGKRLSALVNPGYSIFDNVFSGNQLGPLKAVLDGAKGLIPKGTGTLGNMKFDLSDLDKMIECTNAIGGSAYAPQVDEMIGRTQSIYDKSYMLSDPSLPTFGEFDSEAFLNDIAVPDLVKDNIIKSTNLNNKIANNAGLAADKAVEGAKDVVEKSTSSLSENSESVPVDQKRENAETNTTITTTTEKIPATKGREPEPAETVEQEAPAQAPVVEVDTSPQELPSDKVPWKSLVTSIEVQDPHGSYASVDPGGAGIPKIKDEVLRSLVPFGFTTQDDLELRVVIIIGTGGYQKKTVGNRAYKDLRFNAITAEVYSNRQVLVAIHGFALDAGFDGIIVLENEFVEPTAEQLRNAAPKAVNLGIRKISRLNVFTGNYWKEKFGA